MSESFENPELNEQELKQAAGGARISNLLIVCRCQRCGKTRHTLATDNEEAPCCCEKMKYAQHSPV